MEGKELSVFEKEFREEFKDFSVNPSDIKFGEQLGEGCFGKVYRGSLRGNNVAVKVLDATAISDEAKEDFLREVRLAKRFPHPNLILLLGAYIQENSCALVFELMETDLGALLKNSGKSFPFKTKSPAPGSPLSVEHFREMLCRLHIALDIAQGMDWLHGHDPAIAHCDLKPQNVLISSSYSAKITDYGLSTLLKGGSFFKGKGKKSPYWEAPEEISEDECDKSVDVYAFGIMLWQIMTGESNPYPDEKDVDAFLDHVVEGKRPDVSKLHPGIALLCQSCWTDDPDSRPSFEKVIQFLNGFIAEYAFPDEESSKWWQNVFGESRSVSWEDFVTKADKNNERELAEMAKEGHSLPEIDPAELETIRSDSWRELKSLVVEEGSGGNPVVTIESFGQLLFWLDGISSPEIFTTYFDRLLGKIHSLMNVDCFFKLMKTEIAETTLSGKPTGSYLLRFSSSVIGAYTVSFLFANKGKAVPYHIRVLYNKKDGCYFFDVNLGPNRKITGTTLEKLLEEGKAIGLTNPLSHKAFFDKSRSDGYHVGTQKLMLPFCI